jgi:hypothetical protein
MHAEAEQWMVDEERSRGMHARAHIRHTGRRYASSRGEGIPDER